MPPFGDQYSDRALQADVCRIMPLSSGGLSDSMDRQTCEEPNMRLSARSVIAASSLICSTLIDANAASAACIRDEAPTSILKSIGEAAYILQTGDKNELERFASSSFQAIGAKNNPAQGKPAFGTYLGDVNKKPFVKCDIYSPIINVYGNFGTGTFTLILERSLQTAAPKFVVMYPTIILSRASEGAPWTLRELHFSLVQTANKIKVD